MPLETLKALAKQVNALGGALVFRGLVNGNFKETALKLKELGQEVLIDPTLFEAYGITSVPTFVLRRSAGDMLDEKVPYDRLRGNVSLPHALEQFGTQGDGQEEAQTLLQKLKKS
jgi:type-F conjugative transfer system pilin assembly protein TrbC